MENNPDKIVKIDNPNKNMWALNLFDSFIKNDITGIEMVNAVIMGISNSYGWSDPKTLGEAKYMYRLPPRVTGILIRKDKINESSTLKPSNTSVKMVIPLLLIPGSTENA